jgi:hypothetical protein
MGATRRVRPMIVPSRFALGLAGWSLAVGLALAGDEPKVVARPATDLPPVTREHLLTKVPNFFSFDYPFPPLPGKRIWLRVDDKTFVERYPDGTESRFTILGRARARDVDGVIVAKAAGAVEKTETVNDGGFQVFIPDKDARPRAILFRHLGGLEPPEWKDMAWSQNKITEIQNVE